METIRYLLNFIIKFAFGLFLLAFVIWLVGFLYPQFKLSTLVSSDIFKRDWLPAPRNYASFFAPKNADGTYGKIYVSNTKYNGSQNTVPQNNSYYQSQPGVDFVAYTESGTKIIKGSGNVTGPVVPNTTNYKGASPDRSLYIRNLSVFEGSNIFYGQTFVGEARDIMWKNGVFQIVIVDVQGSTLASFQAVNTGSWAVPGWSRFQATIPVRLPRGVPCGIVFVSAAQNIRVHIPVRCN